MMSWCKVRPSRSGTRIMLRLARFARAVADPPFSVADDDESGKAETPAALHHLGNAIDVDKLFGEFGLFALARLPLAIAARAPLALGACHDDSFRNRDR